MDSLICVSLFGLENLPVSVRKSLSEALSFIFCAFISSDNCLTGKIKPLNSILKYKFAPNILFRYLMLLGAAKAKLICVGHHSFLVIFLKNVNNLIIPNRSACVVSMPEISAVCILV